MRYAGPNLAGMAKSRAGAQKPEVEKVMGQHHVFYFTDDPDDMTEEEVGTRSPHSLSCTLLPLPLSVGNI
jgi:hypothetical protein